MHNGSEKDYYCYLINIDTDGAISAIFPDPEARMESARIRAGKNRELTLEDGVLTVEQAGEETIKLITSTRPIEVSLVEQSKFHIKGNKEWATGQIIFEVK